MALADEVRAGEAGVGRAPPRYWAFLSYSHADKSWADWLHRSLEGYVVPKRLVGRPTPVGPAPRRFRPIFRDREELGASADLNERLRDALEQSAYLIVVCSTAAAASRWVDAEIRHFKAFHGEGRIIAVIVGGAPFASDTPENDGEECFPLALRRHVRPDGTLGEGRIEVVAADLRPGGDGRRLGLLKVLSGLLDSGLDQVIQRDARRRQQQLWGLTGAVSAGALVLGGLAFEAARERDRARAQREEAEALVAFMVQDLARGLERAGRLDVMDQVADRAYRYYVAQESRGLNAQSLGRRSRVLHLLGEIRDRRGDLVSAQAFFEEAAASTAELVQRRPNDARLLYDHAQSVFWVGYLAWRRGQDDVARERFLEYQRLAERLIVLDPASEDFQLEVAYANSNLGTVLLEEGRTDEAAAAFARQLAIVRALATRSPGDVERQFALGQALAWLADAELQRGRNAQALAHRREEAAIYTRLLARAPGDNTVAAQAVVARTGVGRALLASGDTAGALTELRPLPAEIERLLAAAPNDLGTAGQLFRSLQAVAQAELMAGEPVAAERSAARALRLMQQLSTRDQSVADWSGRLGAARLLVWRIAALRASTSEARRESLRGAAAEAARLARLANARPRNLPLLRAAAEAELLAGDAAALSGDTAGAMALWRASASRLENPIVHRLPPTDRLQMLRGAVERRLAQVQTLPPRQVEWLSLDYAW